jgi:CheY-like chemotaxis protein
MGGFISVETQKGKGTTVSVVLELEKGMLSSLDPTEPISYKKIRLAGKKVLVADDNDMNQLLAKTILSNAGIDVVEANNGVEVLQRLKNDSFDLVLMDVQMPEMDGIQATKIIRHGINKEIPIIALTAMAFKDDEQLCAEAGMNDYLSKPFVENQLLSIVAKWTVGKEDARQIRDDIPRLDEAGDGKLYDLSNLREIARGDQVFVDKMVRLFIEESSNAVKQMLLAYVQTDWGRIQKIAHRLKPSVENMGIYTLRDDILELETKAAEYQVCDRLSDLIGHFQKVIEDVVVQLQQSLEKTE